MKITATIQPQFKTLFTESYQECAIWSGRGAGKSWAVADYLIFQALSKKHRILCTREIQNSIQDSVLKLLVDRINHYKLHGYFQILKSGLYCKNGSEFIFKGLKHNVDSIKSMEAITITWIEEAQTISNDSLDILLPTLFRVKDCKIIYTYNPRYSTDAVYKRFNGDSQPDDSIVLHVTSEQNKHFSEAMEKERAFAFKTDPEVANHVWNGALCPTSSAMSVLPLHWLKKAVDAHKQIKNFINNGYEYIGFDIADTGDDHCAIAHIKGSVLKNVMEFDQEYISRSVDFVHNYAKDKSITRIYYDATGIGAGAKSDFNRINERDYTVEAFVGASSVKCREKAFTDKITNAQYFRNLKAQAWWNVRLRLENTLRLLDGEEVNLKRCLFIDGNIQQLDKLLMELSQASYLHEDGKLMVDKQPDNKASPNLADAVVMAFTKDLNRGIQARC